MVPAASPAVLLFARAHLRSRAARAVYAVLAGGTDEWWSTEEVAGHVRLDAVEVDQTLRRFAAAGIVDERRDEHGPRYRWSAGMRYLFDTGDTGDTAAADVDPVCGMPVDASARFDLQVGERHLRFCSLECKLTYAARLRGATPH